MSRDEKRWCVRPQQGDSRVDPGQVTVTMWVWLAAAAVLVGVAKTAVSSLGSVAVVIFAAILPTRESTGAILPLLLCGDVVAISYYRRHADWAVLTRLLPGVLPGILLGAWFLTVASDTLMRYVIGSTLLVMSALQLVQRAGLDND